jgi:hypothetical protein
MLTFVLISVNCTNMYSSDKCNKAFPQVYCKLRMYVKLSYEIGSPVYVQCSICEESCTTKFTANHLKCRFEFCSGIVCARVWQNQLLVHAWCSEITDMTDLLYAFVIEWYAIPILSTCPGLQVAVLDLPPHRTILTSEHNHSLI